MEARGRLREMQETCTKSGSYLRTTETCRKTLKSFHSFYHFHDSVILMKGWRRITAGTRTSQDLAHGATQLILIVDGSLVSQSVQVNLVSFIAKLIS